MPCPLCRSDSAEFIYERKDPHLGFRRYYQCPQCYLTFLDPKNRLTAQAEKTRYDLHQNSPDDPRYCQFLNQLLDPLILRLKPQTQGLDFGCGPGPTVSKLLEEKGYVVKEYDPFYFPQQELLNETYDFITCTETVEHFYDPRAEFERFHRLLKYKGLLGIMTKFRNPQDEFATWWYHQEPTHVSFYQRETIRWIAKWLGWRIELLGENVVIFGK